MTLRVDGKTADTFVQGTAMLDALSRSAAFELLDGVAELGATTFDLAHAYGGGASESLLGEWLLRHGRREDLFLITKGGHPSGERRRIQRDAVRSDLETSLQRLGTDHVDLYLLHRDDEDVPVDEIVTFIDELRREGLMRAYGASNWRHERIAEARAYARRHGLHQMIASSPHFSLAVPTEPPWPGCVSIAGPEGAAARAYHRRERLPVLAWSSLAMGYFALDDRGLGAAAGGGAAPAVRGREQSMSERVFGAPANAARRRRARTLARAHGDSATQVAFRYALSQPLEVHPIVGCRSVSEYAALQDASRRPLSADETRWLEQGAEERSDAADPSH